MSAWKIGAMREVSMRKRKGSRHNGAMVTSEAANVDAATAASPRPEEKDCAIPRSIYRVPTTAAPPYFDTLCRLCGANPRLIQELWQALCAMDSASSRALAFAVNNLMAPAASIEDMRMRYAQIEKLLPPSVMLAATRRLSPEGQPRRRDVRQFEQRMLTLVSPEGTWSAERLRNRAT